MRRQAAAEDAAMALDEQLRLKVRRAAAAVLRHNLKFTGLAQNLKLAQQFDWKSLLES